MGKRSDYELRPRDKYFTPEDAVKPLSGKIDNVTFCEPCAGDGRLVLHLEKLFGATCFLPLDIEPNAPWITEGDAINLNEESVEHCDMIITNPPFTWNILRPLMEHWITLRPTLLLLPADFMHNQRMRVFMKNCRWVASIGRVKWIEGSTSTGVDNYCWYCFDKDYTGPTVFYEREE